jgi:uncharacterized protein (TIGR03083 family)
MWNGDAVGIVMTVDEHVGYLDRDGRALAAAAERAGWGAPVPGTDWTVRELVTHVGGVHRWAADIVRTGSATGATEAGRAVGSGPGDGELLAWFRDGHAALIDTLRAAPEDLECFTFLPAASPLAFWARRQAHETAVHRADAQAAAAVRPGFDVAFAQDGIAEVLHGFAARKSNAIDRAATLLLRPTDGGDAWLITMGGERIVADRAEPGDADATVSGSSGDLYLWLWNRPSAAVVSGDELVAQLWQTVQVRWS